FKAGSNEPLLLLPRPASTALDRRDHFNRMLRHMTTPSATTRTSDVRINLARRPSPGAYVADGMKLGVQPAFGTSDMAGNIPFFRRLAAVRWALRCVA